MISTDGTGNERPAIDECSVSFEVLKVRDGSTDLVNNQDYIADIVDDTTTPPFTKAVRLTIKKSGLIGNTNLLVKIMARTGNKF